MSKLKIGKLLSVDTNQKVDGVVADVDSAFLPQKYGELPQTSQGIKFFNVVQQVNEEVEGLETLLTSIDKLNDGLQQVLRSQADLQVVEGAAEATQLVQRMASAIKAVFDQDIIGELSEQVFNK